MRLKRYKYVICMCVLVIVYYLFGVGDYIQAKSYEHDFNYPLNLNLEPLIEELLNGTVPKIQPINYYPYRFLSSTPKKCIVDEKPSLIILVKSAMKHFKYRNAIRQTWGLKNRFSDVTIKLLFFLGIDESPKSDIQDGIEDEASKFNDIIQSNFIDNYYNNTIKTMMSFRWVYENCPHSDYYLFSDDDMFISVSNLIKYLENPSQYPKAHMTDESLKRRSQVQNRHDISTIGVEKDVNIFAGFVFKSAPHRNLASKWRVTLKEYPWDMWPPYVTAGAYVVSNSAMKKLYLGSLYVKHFRFDDIFLGIVAKRVGLQLTHCNEFYFYKKPYRIHNYRYVIASHGYSDQNELIRVWHEQNNLGYA